MRINKNISSGCFFILLSAILWFLIPSQIKTLGSSVTNAQFLPKVVTAALFIISLIFLIQSIFATEEEKKKSTLVLTK